MLSLAAAIAAIKANPGKFYTYVLSRPGGAPFYVGMGKGKRVADHGKNTRRNERQHKHLIIRKIIREGASVGYSISFFETRLMAADDEKRLIALYGRLDTGCGPLTNRTDGGDGGSGSIQGPEARAKRSASGKRLWADPAHRAKVLAAAQSPDALAALSTSAKRAWSDPNYRARTSAAMKEAAKKPERLTQIASARKGKPMSAEYRQKISRANKGRKFTAEHCAKIGESRRQDWADPEFRSKMVERQSIVALNRRGEKQTDEHKAKVSAALRGRVFTEKHKANLSSAQRARAHKIKSAIAVEPPQGATT